ncbi:hypothetical protein P7K49_001375, partial [Saguinus oedipus]
RDLGATRLVPQPRCLWDPSSTPRSPPDPFFLCFSESLGLRLAPSASLRLALRRLGRSCKELPLRHRGVLAGLEMLPPLTLGPRLRSPRERAALQPRNPLPSKFPLPPLLAHRWDQDRGHQRRTLPRRGVYLVPTNSSSPAALPRGSGFTVFPLPLPGRRPPLPQGCSEEQKRERRVPVTKAAGAAGAEMKPQPALTACVAAAAGTAGASPPPARRAQCATAPPRSRFQDPLRVDSAARGSAPSGRGRGGD